MSKKQSAYLIGITGGSGSGKSTFIEELRKRFKDNEICVLSQDNYYKGIDEQKIDENGVHNFDILHSIDMAAFESDVVKLMNGEVVTIEEYTFNNDLKKPNILVFKPAPIVIVEGLFVFASDVIKNLMNLKVYVYAHEVKKVIRRINRDGIERNYPLDDVLYRYENHVLPSYLKYIEPVKEEADIIINNNNSMTESLNIFEAYLRFRLRSTYG